MFSVNVIYTSSSN